MLVGWSVWYIQLAKDCADEGLWSLWVVRGVSAP